MLDKIIALHQLRQERTEIAAALAEMRTAWEEAAADIMSEKMAVAASIEELETEIKAQRLAGYDGEDKSKKLGVGVREQTVLYYIHQEAYNWAIEHKLALNLDTRAFERIAKDSSIDFVTVEKVPMVTIAADLSEFID